MTVGTSHRPHMTPLPNFSTEAEASEGTLTGAAQPCYSCTPDALRVRHTFEIRALVPCVSGGPIIGIPASAALEQWGTTCN